MTIILFGSTGALGSAILSALRKQDHHVECLDARETNGHKLIANITNIQHSHIINAAAMVGLDRCYSYPRDATIINTMFPHILAIAARASKSKLLHFSTEAVFACNKPGMVYSETDEPDPQTVYGQSKFKGEPFLENITGYEGHVIRLPMLYGPTAEGQVIAQLIRRAASGTPIRVATDIYSTPVYIPHVARYVRDWVKQDTRHYKLLHLGSDQLMSLYQFFKLLFSALGIPRHLLIAAKSTDFASHEPKPLHGGLRSNYLPAMSLDAGIQLYAAHLLTSQLTGEHHDRTGT